MQPLTPSDFRFDQKRPCRRHTVRWLLGCLFWLHPIAPNQKPARVSSTKCNRSLPATSASIRKDHAAATLFVGCWVVFFGFIPLHPIKNPPACLAQNATAHSQRLPLRSEKTMPPPHCSLVVGLSFLASSHCTQSKTRPRV